MLVCKAAILGSPNCIIVTQTGLLTMFSTKVIHVAMTRDLCDWPHTHGIIIDKITVLHRFCYACIKVCVCTRVILSWPWYWYSVFCIIRPPASWLCCKGNHYIQVPLYYIQRTLSVSTCGSSQLMHMSLMCYLWWLKQAVMASGKTKFHNHIDFLITL